MFLLYCLEWFHKDRLSRRRRAVHDTWNFAFEFRSYRDDEAVSTNRDEFVARTTVLAQAAKRTSEAFFDRAMLAFDGTANTMKFRRSVVREGAVGLDLAAQLSQQKGARLAVRNGTESSIMQGAAVCICDRAAAEEGSISSFQPATSRRL